ncbi:MAG: hypothetical protein V4729_04490 [Pseudomonadota bacterium]
MRRAVLALVALVLVAGIFSPVPPPDPFHGSDKVGHALGFLALALCARAVWSGPSPAWLWAGLLLAGPVLEWLQHWVSPARQRSLDDALANMAGVLLAMALCWAWSRWHAWRRAEPPPA